MEQEELINATEDGIKRALAERAGMVASLDYICGRLEVDDGDRLFSVALQELERIGSIRQTHRGNFRLVQPNLLAT